MGLLRELRRTRHWVRRSYSPHGEGDPILRAKELTLEYESGLALDHVSFELQAGGRVAVVGPNGAGKSTLFKVIAGVLEPDRGEIQVFGHHPGGHICIAYVPQRSQTDWQFPVTVADVVMMGRVGAMGLFRHPSSRDREIVDQSLAVVNLEALRSRQISQLSGGQQQRMFIARALAQEAELMLMDEPLTGLDIGSQESIFEVLEALHERGVTVMVALHDLELAAAKFDLVMVLNRRLYGLGTPDQVLAPEVLVEAYGGRLHFVETDAGMVALGDTCCDEGGHNGD